MQKQIEYYENINNTRWNLTIQRVNYPNITISIIKELKNGTTLENYEGNVETGNPDLNMWIVSPDLSIGNPIYKYASDPNIPTINQMDKLEFANATRDVVIANFTQESAEIVSGFWSFWDRETGLLCGMSSRLKYQGEEFVFNAEVDILIVETNLWIKTKSKPDENVWPIIVTLIIILLIAVALFRKRKKKRK